MSQEMQIQLKAKGTVEWTNDVTQLQNMPVAAGSNMPGIASLDASKGNVHNIPNTTDELLYSISDTLKQVLQQFRVLSDPSSPIAQRTNTNGGIFSQIIKNMSTPQEMSKIFAMAGTGVALYDGFNTYRRSMLRGDYLGAQTNGMNVVSSGLDSVGNALMGLSIIPGFGFAPAIIGGTLKLGSLATKAIASRKEVTNEQSRITSENSDVYSDILRAYGFDTLNKSAYANASQGIDLFSSIVKNNKGYGILDSEYAMQVARMKGYGLTKDQAIAAANTAGSISTSTNADFEAIANIEGLISRYGGNGKSVIQSLYNNAEKMGFNEMQFNELMNGIESAMQNGINKGFLASTSNIESVLTGLTNASNGSAFWSGKEGLQRINSVKSGMEAAVGLNTSSDMMMYQAVQRLKPEEKEKILQGNYIPGNDLMNNRMIMEMGELTPEIYNNLIEVSGKMYGDDINSRIEALNPYFKNSMLSYQAIQNGKIEDLSNPDENKPSGLQSLETFTVEGQNAASRNSTTNRTGLQNLFNNTPIDDNSYSAEIMQELIDSQDQETKMVERVYNEISKMNQKLSEPIYVQ